MTLFPRMEIPNTTQQSLTGDEIISSVLAPRAVHLPTQASYNPSVIPTTVAALIKTFSTPWMEKFPAVEANRAVGGAAPKANQVRKDRKGEICRLFIQKNASHIDSDPLVRIQRAAHIANACATNAPGTLRPI